jgi:hypothetical protein
VPRGRLAAAVTATILAGSGCARDREGGIPAACSADAPAVERALTTAPRPVRLGGVRLSACLGRSSAQGDLETVGSAWIGAASNLAALARRDPESGSATRLGYLIGAARRGAGRTQGIHTELLRRLELELAPVDTRSRAFRLGERAGRASG